MTRLGPVALLLIGCTSTPKALPGPVAVEASRLPAQFREGGATRYEPLDVAKLARPQSADYRLRAGDSVWIEGVPGLQTASEGAAPLKVGADGRLAVGPHSVQAEGQTLPALGEALRRALGSDDEFGPPVRASFAGAATFKVMVTRHDLGKPEPAPVELPGFRMDLPHLLHASGGLPSWESAQEIVIRRKDGGEVRLPMRRKAGEPAGFVAEDAGLFEGDAVTVSAREVEVFYVRGPGLPARPQPLPVNRPLDAVEAVRTLNPGLVFTSVELRREVAPGRVLAAVVDVARAASDPRERIAVKPGDVLSPR